MVARRKVRGRERPVIVVNIHEDRVRRNYARLHRAAAKSQDSATYYKKAIAATHIYANFYIEAMRELKKHNLVERERRVVGDRYHTTMWQSLNALNAWRRELEARLADLRERRRQGHCQRWPALSGFTGKWLVNANGYIFVMTISRQGPRLSGDFRGITTKDPSTTRVLGTAGKRTIKFTRLSSNGYPPQHYRGTLTLTQRGRRLIGTFSDKGKRYKWCAVDARLVPRTKWSRWTDCSVGGRARRASAGR